MQDQPRRLPLWGHLLCMALAGLTLGAAIWQHLRAEHKDALQRQVDLRMAQPPLSAAELASLPAAQLRWRRTAVSGSFDADGQFLVDNRVREGQAGFHVIAPLAIAPELWVLVNRGWTAAPAVRSEASVPPLSAAGAAVAGLLVADAAGAFALDAPQVDGIIWQNLDIARWQAQTGRAAVPAVLLADADEAGLAAVSARPDFRADRSRGYRLQWALLFAVVIAGWIRVSKKFKTDET